MVSVPVQCPPCHSTAVIKAGKQATGTQRYQCQNGRCAPRHRSQDGADQRDHLEEPGRDCEGEHVRQPDHEIPQARGHPDGQPLATDEGTELELNLLPDAQHVRPARNRKEGQEQALQARHFHRPVEPDHQHRDEGDNEGDRPGRKAEGTGKEGRRGPTEALRERGERRQSLPEEAQQRDLSLIHI